MICKCRVITQQFPPSLVPKSSRCAYIVLSFTKAENNLHAACRKTGTNSRKSTLATLGVCICGWVRVGPIFSGCCSAHTGAVAKKDRHHYSGSRVPHHRRDGSTNFVLPRERKRNFTKTWIYSLWWIE